MIVKMYVLFCLYVRVRKYTFIDICVNVNYCNELYCTEINPTLFILKHDISLLFNVNSLLRF